MNCLYSSREIEDACKRDVNFMYLLGGASAPDHSTIARFRSIHLALVSENTLANLVNILGDKNEISKETLFIDGTKIESSANRYTFVWKKSVTKHMQKMMDKIPDFVLKCEIDFNVKVICQNKIKMYHLKKLLKKLKKIAKEEDVMFVNGKGKRKTPIQKAIEELEEYITRLKNYTKHLHIMGERNSYSKTDNDATFMRTKEDHMKNGQLSFIKPVNYEISKTRKYKNDIGKIDNMTYDEENDYYICENKKKLTRSCTKTRKSKTGYKNEITCYTCEDCNNCEFKSKCIKGNNSKTPMENRTKNLQTSKLFNEKRKENLDRIVSPEGAELRMNRSIQAEGTFAQVKGNMGFRRALCKGEKNVLAECILLGMAHNINKYHNKIKKGKCATYLHPIKMSS